jgi:hypothetical protein
MECPAVPGWQPPLGFLVVSSMAGKYPFDDLQGWAGILDYQTWHSDFVSSADKFCDGSPNSRNLVGRGIISDFAADHFGWISHDCSPSSETGEFFQWWLARLSLAYADLVDFSSLSMETGAYPQGCHHLGDDISSLDRMGIG